MSCNSECKLGCKGTAIYECNECRGFKLYLKDASKIVELLSSDKLRSIEDNDQKQIELSTQLIKHIQLNKNEESSQDSNLYQIIKNYQEYYIKKVEFDNSLPDEDNTLFCVSECPPQMPFQNSNLFCTSDKTQQ